jgi:hypothetical protein
MKIAIRLQNGVAATCDITGREIVGPFRFMASRFVPDDSSTLGPRDGVLVYEGEWATPPKTDFSRTDESKPDRDGRR